MVELIKFSHILLHYIKNMITVVIDVVRVWGWDSHGYMYINMVLKITSIDKYYYY